MTHTRALFLCTTFAVITGCTNSEIGDYRLDDVIMFSAACTAGVDTDRATTWTDAMSSVVPDDMSVTRGGAISTAPTQAIFSRPDSSVFHAEIVETDERTFHGERFAEATTVAEGSLGTDFSVLLESESIGCEFDITTTVDFDFGESGYDVVTGELIVEVSETAALSDDRCPISSCTVEWSFAGVNGGGTGGDRIDE